MITSSCCSRRVGEGTGDGRKVQAPGRPADIRPHPQQPPACAGLCWAACSRSHSAANTAAWAARSRAKATACAGMAVRSALSPGLSSGQFVALPLLDEPVELPYVLAYRSGVRLLPVVERFRRVLLEHVGRLMAA